MPSWVTDIDDEVEGEGGWGGTTVGAVCGESGAVKEASCKDQRAWTSLRKATISTQSSTMVPVG